TDRVRLWIFEHDPALRKLGRYFFEIGRLAPFLGGLALDCDDVVEHQSFLTIARQAKFSGKFLSGPQMIKLNRGARHINVLRDRQEIQLRITQQAERIGDLIEKTLGRDVGPLAERRPRDVQNMMMPRSRGMEMQIEIARDRKEIVKFFQLVDAQLSSSRGASRTGTFFWSRRP